MSQGFFSLFFFSLHPLKVLKTFFLQARFRSSAFKPVTPKNFSSMQNLYPSSKSEDMDHGLSNGLHRSYAHVSKAVSTSSSSSSPSRHGGATSSGNKVSSMFLALSLNQLTTIAGARQLTVCDLAQWFPTWGLEPPQGRQRAQEGCMTLIKLRLRGCQNYYRAC